MNNIKSIGPLHQSLHSTTPSYFNLKEMLVYAPKEIFLEIFKYLSKSDLVSLSQTSKTTKIRNITFQMENAFFQSKHFREVYTLINDLNFEEWQKLKICAQDINRGYSACIALGTICLKKFNLPLTCRDSTITTAISVNHNNIFHDNKNLNPKIVLANGVAKKKGEGSANNQYWLARSIGRFDPKSAKILLKNSFTSVEKSEKITNIYLCYNITKYLCRFSIKKAYLYALRNNQLTKVSALITVALNALTKRCDSLALKALKKAYKTVIENRSLGHFKNHKFVALIQNLPDTPKFNKIRLEIQNIHHSFTFDSMPMHCESYKNFRNNNDILEAQATVYKIRNECLDFKAEFDIFNEHASYAILAAKTMKDHNSELAIEFFEVAKDMVFKSKRSPMNNFVYLYKISNLMQSTSTAVATKNYFFDLMLKSTLEITKKHERLIALSLLLKSDLLYIITLLKQ